MKYNIDSLIVVEGKSDESFLSSLINGFFFITNGYDLNNQKIQFLIEVSKARNIIILTDPDEAGKSIREKLLSRIGKCDVVMLSGISRKHYIKKGVAESFQNEVVNALSKFFTKTPNKIYSYHLSLFCDGSLSGKNLKQKLIKKFKLLGGNNKALEKQLNMLKINDIQIKKFVEEENDN